ncbi:MAG: UxaA family hydrolase [Betaproteobacteria bacterium]
MPRALVLNEKDNVATLIDAGKSGDACALQGESRGSITLLGDVPFGHKVCIRDTSAGQEILKYGTVIGKASAAIKAGAHVHVHNVESVRGRGDQSRS